MFLVASSVVWNESVVPEELMRDCSRLCPFAVENRFGQPVPFHISHLGLPKPLIHCWSQRDSTTVAVILYSLSSSLTLWS